MSKSPFVMIPLAVICLFAASLPLTATERPANGATIRHESAGIGDDDPLAAIAGDYNLQLVFALQGSGEYLADIRVLIADARGNALLDEISSGPLFFVRLPAGSYRVNADFHGTPLKKSVTVSDRRLQNLYFYWPHEVIQIETGRY